MIKWSEHSSHRQLVLTHFIIAQIINCNWKTNIFVTNTNALSKNRNLEHCCLENCRSDRREIIDDRYFFASACCWLLTTTIIGWSVNDWPASLGIDVRHSTGRSIMKTQKTQITTTLCSCDKKLRKQSTDVYDRINMVSLLLFCWWWHMSTRAAAVIYISLVDDNIDETSLSFYVCPL